MIASEKAGLSTNHYLENILNDRLEDLKAFNISYDCYHSTDSKENQALCYDIYARIQDYIE